MIKVGVIGYGYWGPKLVRNLFEVPETQVVAVSDMREERLQQVRSRYPSVETTTDFRQMLANPKIDAIAIATPVHTHYELALEALAARGEIESQVRPDGMREHWLRDDAADTEIGPPGCKPRGR